ncbi:uncharacterized protein LOC121267169 [Juglans microcarpa x Juglans regia]|uniref:uncharacterized protein LOC121267169 n=1 Tax=Juglans microcarpa x Juglans regia TaxID=2249226 RepID=UPI001B7E1C9C|nr:uncharacterized protein LOC121267169 [Juglans microcarpa x Juglans regia]
MDPKLLKSDDGVKTYRIEDEVCVEEFTKPVTYYVDFSEIEIAAKHSCGLFQMRGILCRHILAVFKCNKVKFVPNRYILERWMKDIKMRYTLIHSSFDAGDQRADANRYSSLLNISYKMITLATGLEKHTEDATHKLFAMIDLYGDNQEPLSMTVTGSNVGCTTKDTTICGSSKKVLSLLVVRGKGRPPSLRKASGMEKCMRKHELGKWSFKRKSHDTHYEGYVFPLLVEEQSDFWPEKDVAKENGYAKIALLKLINGFA